MKTCFKCHKRKRLNEFYRHAGMSDGHLNKCIRCAVKEASQYQKANLDKIRLSRHRPKARAAINKRKKLWVKENPEKRRAQWTVSNAVQRGKLKRKPCEKCGKVAHAHHPDYSKPLKIKWLCALHHKAEHRKLETKR